MTTDITITLGQKNATKTIGKFCDSMQERGTRNVGNGQFIRPTRAFCVATFKRSQFIRNMGERTVFIPAMCMEPCERPDNDSPLFW